MGNIGIVGLLCIGCAVKWPIRVSTTLLSVPISMCVHINEKLKKYKVGKKL